MTRDAEHTPSPQSVVVPGEAQECARLLVQELTPDQGQSSGRAFGLAVSLQAMLAAAPAPSSLAGGEVTNDDAPTYMRLAQALSRHPEVMVVERSDPTLELTPDSLEHLLDDVFPLAALSPEAPTTGFMATLTDEQRAEALAYTGPDTHPEAPARKREGLDVLRDWKDPASPSVEGPVAWRWRRPGGVWNYQEDRQIIPGTVCEPLYDHALTPRHEAPASPAWRDEYNRVEAIREAAEAQDRIARSAADPITRSDAETQAAGHWARYEREVAKLNTTPTSHKAPAEGAGERADLITDLEALLAAEPVFVVNHPIQRAINALRARSSAPEAREGEPVGYVDDAQRGSIMWGFNSASLPNGTPLYTHPAAPSADKLREFGQHTNFELSYRHGEEGDDGSWQVHRVNGGVNDREWTLIGSGATPSDAIDQAIATLKAEGA